MPNALPNPSGDIFTLTASLRAQGLAASRKSPRLRMILPVQRSQEARVQRLLNFLQPGTYIRPHCHPLPHATESICLLQGELQVIIFQTDGTITDRHLLDQSSPLIDIEPGTWHGMIVTKPDTIVFETKQGPYDAKTDKKFAPWSPPEENDIEKIKYLNQLNHF